jgi:hypothetical protein
VRSVHDLAGPRWGNPNPNVRAIALHCLDGNGEPVSFVAVYESHCIVGLDGWYAMDGGIEYMLDM